MAFAEIDGADGKKSRVSLEKDRFSTDKRSQEAATRVKTGARKASTKEVGRNFHGEDAAAVSAVWDLVEILEYAAGNGEYWRDAFADSSVSGKNRVFAEVSEISGHSNDIVDRRQY